MRDFKGMKRQRGRNRKPGGGGGSGGGGGGGSGGGHNPNRAFESNGPENVKIRGAAQHVYERYQQLARDSFASGDRVLAENYLQHAEHYFRVLRTLQPQRPVSEIAARDAFASGFDIDFEDENDEIDTTSTDPQDDANANEQPQADYRGDRNGAGNGNGNGGGNDRNGEFRRDREFRGDRNGGEPRQDNRPPRQDNRPEFRNESRGEPRSAPSAEARPDAAAETRAETERRESRRERFERRRDERGRRPEGQADEAAAAAPDPLAVVEPKAAPLVSVAADEASPMLRAQDGAESQMPAFLRQAVAPAPAAEVVEKPRRTRRRRPESFEAAAEGEAPAPAAEEQA